MSKFSGIIGINRGPVETSPGVYEPVIEDIQVTGELRRQKTSWGQASMSEGLRPQHTLSIVTPDDADINFAEVVYIEWQDRKWSVTSIEYIRPRLELGMGGLYNG